MIEDPNRPEEDPAEGSQETIENELKSDQRPAKGTAESALNKQVKEKIELPQKGAP